MRPEDADVESRRHVHESRRLVAVHCSRSPSDPALGERPRSSSGMWQLRTHFTEADVRQGDEHLRGY